MDQTVPGVLCLDIINEKFTLTIIEHKHTRKELDCRQSVVAIKVIHSPKAFIPQVRLLLVPGIPGITTNGTLTGMGGASGATFTSSKQ